MASDYEPGGRFPDTVGTVGKVQTIQPALVIVELGGNDFIRDRDLATFDVQYRTLLANIREVSPRSRIVQVILWEPGARLAPNPVNSWSAYADRIAAVAAEQGNWLVDLRQYIPVGGTPDDEGLFLTDNVHLTAAGHRVVGAALWTLLWART